MQMLRLKEAFIMEALGEQLGWHGRVSEGNVYVSAVYESRGLYVNTIERCLYFIPREELTYEPGYDAMRLELQGLFVWPDLPKRGLPEGIQSSCMEIGKAGVAETLHRITGLPIKEIKNRLESSKDNEVMSFKAPAPSHEKYKKVSFEVLPGFTKGECREGAIARTISPQTPTGLFSRMPSPPSLKLLEDKTLVLKKKDEDVFDHATLPYKEEGFYSEIIENLMVVSYENIILSIESDLKMLRGLIVPGESEHNDEILDEYNKLSRQRAQVEEEQSSYEA